MAPGGRFMAESDDSWGKLFLLSIFHERPLFSKYFETSLVLLEPISKIGFWFKIAAGQSFKPEAYCCMLRI